jgi:hypothetical protein
MEYWEFLLQKEGDHSWLPLDVSQVEILEGRYRVMAHSSQGQTPVRVQISQLLLDQVPPKRRTLRRQGETNADGLMVVMPFTRLEVGLWDIQCSGDDLASGGDPTSEAPQSWRYGIQLRVLAQGMDEEGDWFADEGTTLSRPPFEGSPEPVEPVAPSPATPPWPTLDLSKVAKAMNLARQHLVETGAPQNHLYTVSLDHTALVGAEAQPLTLTGQVSGVVEGESCSDMALVVRLVDPQSAETLTLVPFGLSSPALPAAVNLAVTLPPQLSTRLLVGEVGLVSLSAGTVNMLALQGFTVTVNLLSLFDAIANRAESQSDLDIVFPADGSEPTSRDGSSESSSEAATAEDGWSLVDLPQSPPRVVPVVTLPRSSSNLPPKIYYPSPHEAKTRRPTLPPTGKLKPTFIQPSGQTDAEGRSDETTPADITSDFLDSISLPASPPATERSSPSDSDKPAPELTLPPVVQRPTASRPLAATDSAGPPERPKAVPLLPSHEAMGFKDLKLQERFWSRLNDLAVTLQQAALDQRSEQEAAEEQAHDQGEETTAPAPDPFIPFAGEVVIYDDDVELSLEQEGRGTAVGSQGRDRLSPDPDEVITPPVPDIDAPEGELTAGDAVLLTLRVPFHPNRLYVKVWMTDPQTRSLADEPRQVMNLAPNGRGQLEGSLRLTVPMGCLEVWFEAITVDLITQQESYKATVSRPVAPAGLGTPSLEEFDL